MNIETPTNKSTGESSNLAESFGVDFLTMRREKVVDAMSKIGNFTFRSSGPEGENSVSFTGESEDGTTIKISIEKGNKYKSPAELQKEEQEEDN